MLDVNGYPDEESLEKIKTWDLASQDLQGLLDLIYDNTQWADRQIHMSGKRVIKYEYHTGGWYGNKDVIDALHHNLLFWSFFWLKSLRGGHYYFRIEHPEWYPLNDMIARNFKKCPYYLKGKICNHADAPRPGHSRCVGPECEIFKKEVLKY
jgi:hypothetical protein